jgi:hypothetical protein
MGILPQTSQLVFSKDMGTLDGKSFDVVVGIFKTDNNFESVLNQEIHAESKPCEWIASAVWGFTPEQGNYDMSLLTKQDNSTSYEYSGFSVRSDIPNYLLSPLKQFKSGIVIDKITCKENLQLIIKNNGNPACVKPDTIPKLVERNAIKLSSFYQTRPLIERLHVAMTIIQFSDIPTTILGLDHDQILGIEINDEELNKIPNAQEYYEQKIREIIPFDVPIKVTFGKYWELGE